jgi:hypothetical protein
VSEIPIYSRFAGEDRVSIYSDGSVEIQHEGRSYRAMPERWVEAAEATNRLYGGIPEQYAAAPK